MESTVRQIGSRRRRSDGHLLRARAVLPVLTQPDTLIAARFRGLVGKICSMKKSPRVIGVTSVLPDEGATLVAVNLAMGHAAAGEKVLLVDADFRHPSIADMLSPAPRVGLADVLVGTSGIRDALIRPVEVALTILPAGRVPADPLEALSSPEFDAILDAARKRFERVIIDTSAAYPYGEAHAVLPRSDGTLLVVRSRRTPRRALLDTLSLLRNRRVLGLVRNFA